MAKTINQSSEKSRVNGSESLAPRKQRRKAFAPMAKHKIACRTFVVERRFKRSSHKTAGTILVRLMCMDDGSAR